MPKRPTKPKLDPFFEMAAMEAFYDVAKVGIDASSKETTTKIGELGRKVTGSFLDGRFRCCLRGAMRFLIISPDGPQLRQRAIARDLGVSDKQVQKCKEGLGLMSGSAWTWFVCRMGDYLEAFESPTLEARAIAGYCEAMALVDARTSGGTTPNLDEKPTELEFVLLWTAFGSGVLTRKSAFDEPRLMLEQAESLLRLLKRWFPETPGLARFDSPTKLRNALGEVASRWGVAYAVVLSRVTMDWDKERRRVT